MFGLLLSPFKKLMLVGVIAGAAFFYFTWSQNQISTLTEANVLNEAKAISLEVALDEKDIEFQNTKRELDELNAELVKIRKQAREIAEILSKHDFEFLASQKPGLIERIINKATNDVLDELETETNPETVGE